jgi:CRP-like cAMP-binding protein
MSLTQKHPKISFARLLTYLLKKLFMPKRLVEYLKTLMTINAPLEAFLLKHLEVKHYEQGDIILKHGQTSQFICLIFKGIAQAYYINEKKAKVTSRFMQEKNLIASLLSFMTQRPAEEEIIALEAVTVCGLSHENLYRMYNLIPESNQIGRVFLEQYSMLAELRSLMLRSSSASKKYELFCKHHQDLLGRVSQKQIASFLGMTEETFCRVRNSK